MRYHTKLTIATIRKYNAFLKDCSNRAISDTFAQTYERAMIHIPGKAKIGHTVLKG